MTGVIRMETDEWIIIPISYGKETGPNAKKAQENCGSASSFLLERTWFLRSTSG
jgi:hypothetical protein